MRAVITPLASDTIGPLTLVGRPGIELLPTFGWPRGIAVVGLAKDGLSGWYDSPNPRVSAEEVPTQHGSYWPGQRLMAARVITLKGFMRAESVLDVLRFLELLSALVDEQVSVAVEDSVGTRSVTGYVSDQITATKKDMRTAEFTLIVTCPDPIKYGPSRPVAVEGGRAVVENIGTAATYPVVRAPGAKTLSVTAEGVTVSWEATTTVNLTWDMRTMLPLNGAGNVGGIVTRDGVMALGAGRHVVTVKVTPTNVPVTVDLRSGWK